jgi:hypothetical protein
MDIHMFRAVCLRVADDTDLQKLELLKQRLRLLLSEETTDASASDQAKLGIARG